MQLQRLFLNLQKNYDIAPRNILILRWDTSSSMNDIKILHKTYIGKTGVIRFPPLY